MRNNLRNILDSPIKLKNPFKKEADTHHSDTIPESIIKKLNNSIVRIRIINIKGTGFFMKIKLNLREMRCLFTCFHVIKDDYINDEMAIDIYYGEKNKETHRKIKLIRNERFIKAYKEEDVTLIEIIDEDMIPEDKYLYADLNYTRGYEIYLNKNFFLAGYPADKNLMEKDAFLLEE